jgi:hypothetical protein
MEWPFHLRTGNGMAKDHLDKMRRLMAVNVVRFITSGFQLVLWSEAQAILKWAIQKLDLSGIWIPLYQTAFYHSSTGLVRYSDPSLVGIQIGIKLNPFWYFELR